MLADFSGEQVVQRHMSRLGRELLYHRIEAASTMADRKGLELVLQEYGKSLLLEPLNSMALAQPLGRDSAVLACTDADVRQLLLDG